MLFNLLKIQPICFYVGSSCQAFFVFLIAKLPSLSLRLKGHPFAVGLLPQPHAQEEVSRSQGALGKP